MFRLAGQWERMQLICDEQQRRVDVNAITASTQFDSELSAIERWLIDARNQLNRIDSADPAQQSAEFDRIVDNAKVN